MAKSKFFDDFQELKRSGSVLLPVSVICAFLDFCASENVHPCGGAIVETSGGSMFQYLYL